MYIDWTLLANNEIRPSHHDGRNSILRVSVEQYNKDRRFRLVCRVEHDIGTDLRVPTAVEERHYRADSLVGLLLQGLDGEPKVMRGYQLQQMLSCIKTTFLDADDQLSLGKAVETMPVYAHG